MPLCAQPVINIRQNKAAKHFQKRFMVFLRCLLIINLGIIKENNINCLIFTSFMRVVDVSLGDNSYKINIGKSIVGKIFDELPKAEKYCIITDKNVDSLYGRNFEQGLLDKGLSVHKITLPGGESAKTIETAAKVCQELVRQDFGRNSVIINLGGGVVSDIGAFAASIYKRGIPFINVPTTLLGQVDAAIGGKTGVNLPEGKNMIGTFYQPKAVYCNTDFLDSLDEREFRNGLAEIVKYAIIMDKGLFELLETTGNIRKNIEEIIYLSARDKAMLVSKDEKEAGIRKLCNFGHTIGHAFEALQNYEGISHGEGVAIGAYLESRIAGDIGLISRDENKRINDLILNTEVMPWCKDYDLDRLVLLMKTDKKNIGGKIHFVLPTGIGQCNLEKENYSVAVEEDVIRRSLGLAQD
jgi:3-dehydroquinate synthase